MTRLTHLKYALGLAAALTLPALGGATIAHAQDYDDNGPSGYDGYCYERMSDAQLDQAIANDERVDMTSSHAKCYRGQYFSYKSSYYQPPAPPRGYVTVVFEDRPDRGHFVNVNYNMDPRMMPPPAGIASWRDDRGYWHNTVPMKYTYRHHTYYDSTVEGWRDARGIWHKAPHRPQ